MGPDRHNGSETSPGRPTLSLGIVRLIDGLGSPLLVELLVVVHLPEHIGGEFVLVSRTDGYGLEALHLAKAPIPSVMFLGVREIRIKFFPCKGVRSALGCRPTGSDWSAAFPGVGSGPHSGAALQAQAGKLHALEGHQVAHLAAAAPSQVSFMPFSGVRSRTWPQH